MKRIKNPVFLVFVLLLSVLAIEKTEAQLYNPKSTAAENKATLLKFLRDVYGKESGTTGFFDTEMDRMRLYPTLIKKSENLQIECTSDLLCSNFEIFSLGGKLIKQGILIENISSLNIDESFSPGMYIFKANGSGFQPMKFIVHD